MGPVETESFVRICREDFGEVTRSGDQLRCLISEGAARESLVRNIAQRDCPLLADQGRLQGL